MFKKTIKSQNKKAKIIMTLLFVFGVALLFLAPSLTGKALVQLAGFLCIGAAIYIATAFVLREYTVNIFIPDGADSPDLAIFEFHGKRELKVCHISLSEITKMDVVINGDKNVNYESYKGLKKYKYNTVFDCDTFLYLTVRDEILIMLTFDKELYLFLKNNCANL